MSASSRSFILEPLSSYPRWTLMIEMRALSAQTLYHPMPRSYLGQTAPVRILMTLV